MFGTWAMKLKAKVQENVFDALVHNTRAIRDNHETKWKPEHKFHNFVTSF